MNKVQLEAERQAKLAVVQSLEEKERLEQVNEGIKNENLIEKNKDLKNENARLPTVSSMVSIGQA